MGLGVLAKAAAGIVPGGSTALGVGEILLKGAGKLLRNRQNRLKQRADKARAIAAAAASKSVDFSDQVSRILGTTTPQSDTTSPIKASAGALLEKIGSAIDAKAESTGVSIVANGGQPARKKGNMTLILVAIAAGIFLLPKLLKGR